MTLLNNNYETDECGKKTRTVTSFLHRANAKLLIAIK